MPARLSGDDARIWRLHSEGFPVSSICRLVGARGAYVRGVIRASWRDGRPSCGRPGAA